LRDATFSKTSLSVSTPKYLTCCTVTGAVYQNAHNCRRTCRNLCGHPCAYLSSNLLRFMRPSVHVFVVEFVANYAAIRARICRRTCRDLCGHRCACLPSNFTVGCLENSSFQFQELYNFSINSKGVTPNESA